MKAHLSITGRYGGASCCGGHNRSKSRCVQTTAEFDNLSADAQCKRCAAKRAKQKAIKAKREAKAVASETEELVRAIGAEIGARREVIVTTRGHEQIFIL